MEKIKKRWKCFSIKKCLTDYCEKIFRYYIVSEGGKNRIHFENLLISASFLTCPFLIIYFFVTSENKAFIGRTPNSLVGRENSSSEAQSQKSVPSKYSYPVQQNGNVVRGSKLRNRSSNSHGLNSFKLSAKQVIVREDLNLGFGFYAGSNLIGELQSTVDSRDPNQIVRAVLPYGGKSRDGSAELPRGTLLLGKVNSQGKDEKVFIDFHEAILPEGKSIKLTAIALDPKDYSTGLSGEIQSEAKNRTLSVMGLSALSVAGGVLTEKESMGQYSVEAKASAKNALLAGVSKAAEVEAIRLQGQTEMQDYVQVEAGTAIIVSLTQGLKL